MMPRNTMQNCFMRSTSGCLDARIINHSLIGCFSCRLDGEVSLFAQKMRSTLRPAPSSSAFLSRASETGCAGGSQLEHDLPADLHNARRRIKAQEVAVRAGGRGLHAGDRPERWITTQEIRVGETKIGMVERVERLRANREVEPFPDLEVLEQVQVHVEVVRPAILIAALCGEGYRRHRG